MSARDAELLRLIYLSRNRIGRAPEATTREIDEILEGSQVRNALAGVTGALVFNDGAFGQVLEGPPEEVEETFARIQEDERHDRIRLLEEKIVAERAFPDWSMGFVGADAGAADRFGDVARLSRFDESRLSGEEIFRALRWLAMRRELSTHAGARA